MAEDKSKAGKTALKVHRSVEPYLREREAYGRLRDAGVSEILGFNVPQLIRFDDELRIIEMSIVARPFVLDFAGAWLDTPPDFPEETWAEWEAEKREQFGTLRPRVQAVLEALEALDIHMDVTVNVIGPTVQQDDNRAVRNAGFDATNVQDTGINLLQRGE